MTDQQDEPTVSMDFDEVDLMLLRSSVRRHLRTREKDVERNLKREHRMYEVQVGQDQCRGLRSLVTRINRSLTVVRAKIRQMEQTDG